MMLYIAVTFVMCLCCIVGYQRNMTQWDAQYRAYEQCCFHLSDNDLTPGCAEL